MPELSAGNKPTRANQEYQFQTWHVAFAQNCNLCCTYCSTAHGTYGVAKGRMHESVWHRIIRTALAGAPENRKLRFEFGVGETFLYYNEFKYLLDHLQSEAARWGIPIEVGCSTNGTLLDQGQLEDLARRGISLTFSIDGPEAAHDRHRRDKWGRGSYQRVMRAWKYYRMLSMRDPARPACNVQSVATEETRLADLIRFWREQEQATFACMVQLPTQFNKKYGTSRWHHLQHRYLFDLHAWGMELAGRLEVPKFLSDYQGPVDLYRMWQRLFLGQRAATCGTGQDVIGVDIHGSLYPCEAFMGWDQWCIGTIFDGINPIKLNRFREVRQAAAKICEDCWAGSCCGKNCFGANPAKDISTNFKDGCWFAKRLCEIALETYQKLSNGSLCM